MKFWQSVAFAEPEQLLEIARGAEAAGFEGLLLSEHLFVPEEMAPKYPYAEDGIPDFTGDTPFPDPVVGHLGHGERHDSPALLDDDLRTPAAPSTRGREGRLDGRGAVREPGRPRSRSRLDAR